MSLLEKGTVVKCVDTGARPSGLNPSSPAYSLWGSVSSSVTGHTIVTSPLGSCDIALHIINYYVESTLEMCPACSNCFKKISSFY